MSEWYFSLEPSYRCAPAILERCDLRDAADSSGWFLWSSLLERCCRTQGRRLRLVEVTVRKVLKGFPCCQSAVWRLFCHSATIAYYG
jgi:hypothetical protein